MKIILIGLLVAVAILSSAFTKNEPPKKLIHRRHANDKLKKEALAILEAKCNVCHRSQNPFMLFKEKNVSKRAKKIYQMVFVERKMPKGNEVRLSKEEYFKLEKWLFTQNIY